MNKKLRRRSTVLQARSATTTTSTTAPTSISMVETVMTTSLVKRKCKKSASGRQGKRKTRKTRIQGLDAIDFLHNKTLLSTSSEVAGEKLSPPPGCVDYQFTSLTAIAAETVPIHSELPPATSDTPYALQVLLDLYREQLLSMLKVMRTKDFKDSVNNQIVIEREKNQNLSSRLEQLEKQVHSLIEDSVRLLKARMCELGISNRFSAKDLMIKAKEIMFKHHELQGEVQKLGNELPALEKEHEKLLEERKRGEALLAEEERRRIENIVQSHILPIDKVNGTYGSLFSVVRPRIKESTTFMSSGGLTATERKIKSASPQYGDNIQSARTDISVNQNENQPSVDHIYDNGHHRKSLKKNRKTKKRNHKQDDSYHKNGESSRKDINQSYLSHSPKSAIEEIITTSLSEPLANYSVDLWACKTEEINSNTDVVNKNKTGCEDKISKCDNFRIETQSDYRKVPPLKLALKRHFSRDKAIENITMRTTVGDLVNTEIERSLDLSNHHRINSVAPLPFRPPSSAISTPHRARKSNKHITAKDVSDEYSSTPISHSKFKIKLPLYENMSQHSIHDMSSGELRLDSSSSLDSNTFSVHLNNRNNEPYDKSSHLNGIKPEPNVHSEYSSYSIPNNSTIDLNESPNKWQEVSLGFDRIVEFVSTKLDNEENFSKKKRNAEVLPDYCSKELTISLSPVLKPPPLHRADSPTELDCLRERKSTLRSSSAPALPFSPAPLDGPFSPVSSVSPPRLEPISARTVIPRKEESNEKYYLNEKFHPKGKGWKWR